MPDWRWFIKVRLRFRTAFHRNQVERELEEELRYHIEQRVEQKSQKDLRRKRLTALRFARWTESSRRKRSAATCAA